MTNKKAAEKAEKERRIFEQFRMYCRIHDIRIFGSYERDKEGPDILAKLCDGKEKGFQLSAIDESNKNHFSGRQIDAENRKLTELLQEEINKCEDMKRKYKGCSIIITRDSPYDKCNTNENELVNQVMEELKKNGMETTSPWVPKDFYITRSFIGGEDVEVQFSCVVEERRSVIASLKRKFGIGTYTYEKKNLELILHFDVPQAIDRGMPYIKQFIKGKIGRSLFSRVWLFKNFDDGKSPIVWYYPPLPRNRGKQGKVKGNNTWTK